MPSYSWLCLWYGLTVCFFLGCFVNIWLIGRIGRVKPISRFAPSTPFLSIFFFLLPFRSFLYSTLLDTSANHD